MTCTEDLVSMRAVATPSAPHLERVFLNDRRGRNYDIIQKDLLAFQQAWHVSAAFTVRRGLR